MRGVDRWCQTTTDLVPVLGCDGVRCDLLGRVERLDDEMLGIESTRRTHTVRTAVTRIWCLTCGLSEVKEILIKLGYSTWIIVYNIADLFELL